MALNVSVATLTYGERKTFLYQVVDRLLSQNFSDIYVYCNGLTLANLTEIKERYKNDRVIILFSETNLGSAGGYYELLDYVTKYNTSDYVLLLDDDNLVPQNCYKIISDLNIKDNELYSFHRSDRARAKQVKDLEQPEAIIGGANSFLGRDFFSIFQTGKHIYQGDLAAAPYGGLLLNRKSLDAGVLPKKELYLYADDYEYTYRLVTMFGFDIIFSDAVSIEDLEKSYHLKTGTRLLSNRYSHASTMQLYYSVRNNTWLGLKRNKSKSIFLLNLSICTTLFSLQFLFSRKFTNIKLFFKAIKDGYVLYKKKED
ncbi:glycosyltransferase [Colwellia asteriadis]|uniref:Glycosyltransferase n=1 Tax=Colwellia asteriadis TaxID=517723 RepID=A0ABN1L697_9GAMM